MSNQVPITIKIDSDLKTSIQKFAKNVGLSFSAVVENKLREVEEERQLIFQETLVPNKKFAKVLDEALEDIKHGRNLSQPMEASEAVKHLHKISR